jgi:hypothetical protein
MIQLACTHPFLKLSLDYTGEKKRNEPENSLKIKCFQGAPHYPMNPEK